MIIKKIKETFGQVFHSPEASGTWGKVECAIDEEVVDCKDLETAPTECGPGHFTQGYGWLGKAERYTGVPAPKYLKDDEWFGPAVISDENKDYMEREYEAFKEEAHKFYGTKESENIHQEMYEIATKSSSTTIHLDPVGGSENFQGGSENYHER